MTALRRSISKWQAGRTRRQVRDARRRRAIPSLIAEVLEDRRLPATIVASFEDLGLAPRSFRNDAGASHAFVDGGSSFNNTFTSDFGGIWSGWALSSMTDTTTAGFTNQYSAIAGSGAGGSQTYAIGFPFGDTADPFHPASSFVNLPAGAAPVSIDVTNTTYAYLSMLNGDLFQSAYGPGDFLRLTIEGFTGPNGTGTNVGEVDFVLADFLGSNHSIVNTWQTVDLTSLASAGSLRFGLVSSKNDPQFGIITPAFFAADNLTVSTGAQGTGSVAGGIYNDVDHDGLRDGGEGGLQGWVVQLLSGSTLVASSTPTDSSGNYSISGVAPGTYTLREVPRTGYTQTAPAAPGTYPVTIANGTSLTGLDFGNFQPTLTSIVVTPANPSLARGLTTQFTATGTYSDQSTQDLTSQVTWASSAESTATITAAGLATGTAIGTSTISASLNGVSGSTALTVTAPSLASIAVTPANPSLARGLTEQFTATGTYTDQSTQDLTAQVAWASGTISTATITSGGLATGAAIGTSTVSATLGGVSGSTVLTVTAPSLVSIAVTPAGPSVAKGQTEQFLATGTFSDQTTQDLTTQVTWASSAEANATITVGGLATGAAIGTSTISAGLGGVSGSTVLTITAPVLASIAVTPANPGLARGLTEQFTATGTYSDQSTQDLTGQVTWTSSAQATAAISTVGLATGTALGSSTISAALGGVSGSTVLTITAPALVSIAVTPANPSIAKGLTKQFTATGSYSDQTTQDLTTQVTWVSGTQATATISATGLATGATPGTSSISAALGGVSGSTVLTVTAPSLVSIAVTPPNPSLAKGLTEPFTATGTYSDQTTQDLSSQVTWASSAQAIATINTSGLARGAAPGSSTISAALGGVSGSTVLTITAPALVSIAVSPAGPSIAKGLTEPFTATGTFSDQSTQDLSSQVTWASSAQAVATIIAGGLATGVASGTSSITAALGGVSGSTVLTVTPSTLTSITVTPSSPSIASGLTEQFQATGTYSDRSTQDLTGQVSWSSTDASIASVSPAGAAVGAAVGTSSITATLGGVSGSTVLTVTAANLISLKVSAGSSSLADGVSEHFLATGTYSDGSTRNLTTQVTWASANSSVATINRSGVSTAVSQGQSTISATINGLSASKLLTVTPARLVSIVVGRSGVSVVKGHTTQLTATGVYTDRSRRNVTSQVVWASANRSVATVTRSGLATGASVGASTISASLSGVRGARVLRVTAVPTSPVTLVSLRAGRVNLGPEPELRNVPALVARFSGPLSPTAVQNLAAYTVTAGRAVTVKGGSQVVFDRPITVARVFYDAQRNRAIIVPLLTRQLPALERLRVDVSVLTDPNGHPINNGQNFEASVTPSGLKIVPIASQAKIAPISAAAVDALFA